MIIRRTYIYIVFLLVSWLLFQAPDYAYPGSAPSAKPNIILLSIDTLRADHLSCYGYDRKTSPFIDEFTKDSVLFENVISQSAHTAPSHMSIFSSLMPDVHGVSNYSGAKFPALAPVSPTLAEVLKDSGYLTVGIHGGGNVNADLGFDKGFDYYKKKFNLEAADPGAIPPEIGQWIDKSRQEGKPLFLFLHHYFCHSPYLYGPQELRTAFLENPVEGLATRPEDLAKGGQNKNREFWEKIDLSNPRHRAHVISLYDGGVLVSDHIFREIVELLKEKGVYRNSIIILTSDHGEEFYEHGFKEHCHLFIEHLHVPLIIKFPKNIYAGRRINRRVRLVDLMPLICDQVAIAPPPNKQGISFLPLLTAKGYYDPLIVSNRGYTMRFYQDGYVYSDMPLRETNEWLFDPDTDPREQNNLSLEKPDVVKKMRSVAEKEKKAKYKFARGLQVKTTPPPPGEELSKQLKALGYIE